MAEHVSSRRRVAGGLTCIAAGATALAWGLAGPASAHGNQEPEGEVPNDADCASLAEEFGIEQDWLQFDIDGLTGEDFTNTYVIDDRGTEDESDDATVTITITAEQAVLEWESSIGIDAVITRGSNADFGGFFYLYAPGPDDEEATGDFNLGVPPWGKPYKNMIAGVSFCYDDEFTPPTEPPSSEPSTPPESETPTMPTIPSTEAPTTSTTAPQGELPRTGNNTMPLVAAGAGLLALGVALVAGKRFLQHGAP